MRDWPLLIFLFAAVLLLAMENSCSTASGKLENSQRVEAKRLYHTRCNACHRLYDPRNYSEEEWKLWMLKMNEKSQLNRRQADLLMHYLDEYRAITQARTE